MIEKDIRVGPIRAYRVAHFYRGELYALVRPYGQLNDGPCVCETSFNRRAHRASTRLPVLSCTCGFYSVKNPAELIPNLRVIVKQPAYPFPVNRRVVCGVELWGKVIEHRLGYRSEYQRVCWATSPLYWRSMNRDQILQTIKDARPQGWEAG